MSFKEECKHLDRTKGEKDIHHKGTLGGETISANGVIRHPCMAKEKWITECPGDCRFFEHK